MQLRLELLALLIAISVMAGRAWGVQPSASETDAARRWAQAWFSASPEAAPPFSFVLGGQPFAALRQGWQVSGHSTRLDERRLQRTVTYTDPATGLAAVCTAVEFDDFPAVEWLLELRNTGRNDTPIIEDIQALDWAVTGDGKAFAVEYSLGDSNSADSFAPRKRRLSAAGGEPLVLAPNGGRSSDGYLPFFNVEWGGQGAVIAVGWSGQWRAAFQRAGANALRAQAGMELTHLRLLPAEAIRTPRMLVLFWDGRDPLRGNNLFRQLLMAHYMPRQHGALVLSPICGSVSTVDPDGSYEGPHVRVAPVLAARRIEVLWSDLDPQHWYPGGFPDGTGTWVPDPLKYPHGLKPIGEAAHAAGLEYLLWFEPERVHFGTAIDKEHPEWVMKPEGEWSQLFRLHDPGARKWLTDYIDVQVTAANLDWIRWDFNIEPLGFWRRNDSPDRQGITEIRHLEGLYAMWDELRRRHPGLVIDLCASGGRRLDLETLSRGVPLWHSDLQCSGPHPAADQLQNGGLFRWVPMHGCGDFALEPDYLFRSAMTAGNILATDLTSDAVEPAVNRTVALYKKIRPYLLGDFYPLFPHTAAEEVWYGYQFHRDDLGAGIAVVFRREKSAEPAKALPLKGLDANAEYEVTFEDGGNAAVLTGQALQHLKVEIPSAPGSAILYYREVPH